MRQDIEFESGGETVRGHLYLPEGAGPHPLVVMAGGWCYVRELVQPVYAQSFCDVGCAALVFDYRRLGASDGAPRQHLDPWDQIEDYRNALSFAETLDSVDAERLGVWGISYSGGHALIVGAIDPRVRCVVSTIPVVDGLANMKRVHGSVGFRRLAEAVIEDRRKRFTTGEYGYIPMSSPNHAEELVTWPFGEVTTVFENLQRTDAPAHEHRNTIASVELLMNYSVFPYLERLLNTPTLMIVAGGDDITLWEAEIEAFNRVPTAKKRLFVVDHTTHMVLYSNRSQLEIAADQGARWLHEHLVAPYAG
jgi:cephalosporin-C deacetylase-like acetyl esterase